MLIGTFAASATTTLQIEKKSQVLQILGTGLSAANIATLLGSTELIEVWNNKGKLIPPMTLKQLALLNGDEYGIQMSFSQATGGNSSTYNVIITFELCDEGSIEKTIYVKLTNALAAQLQLAAIDVTGTTAVKIRNYNFMNIVSPVELPKNSLCIMPRSGILQLQKNSDVMSDSEILTHSNRILRDGALQEIHPVLYNAKITTPAVAPNAVYQAIAEDMAMGYGSVTTGNVIICTGEDNFVLYPNSSCAVVYCEKQLTKIAQQVKDALVVAGQANNVDTQEFASAVAAVGNIADKQGIDTGSTQVLANKVVSLLPSVKIAQVTGVKNFNLASESTTTKGTAKIAKI